MIEWRHIIDTRRRYRNKRRNASSGHHGIELYWKLQINIPIAKNRSMHKGVIWALYTWDRIIVTPILLCLGVGLLLNISQPPKNWFTNESDHAKIWSFSDNWLRNLGSYSKIPKLFERNHEEAAEQFMTSSQHLSVSFGTKSLHISKKYPDYKNAKLVCNTTDSSVNLDITIKPWHCVFWNSKTKNRAYKYCFNFIVINTIRIR